MRFAKYQLLLLAWLIMVSCFISKAQDVKSYLSQVGDYAGIYNGRAELMYHAKLYNQLPYYQSPDFTEGEIIYKGNVYPNLQVRLDLYKEQIIISSPERRFRIIVDSEEVQKVSLHGKTFIWHTPPKESGLKSGFYMLLVDSEPLQLFYKETHLVSERTVLSALEPNILYNNTLTKTYYVVYENQYHPVKRKKSFVKLFPGYKKQIRTYVRKNKLNFKRDTDQSLILLTNYCEKLLTQNDSL